MRLSRFLKLTGLELSEVRARAGSPEVMLAVLEHLAADESLLLVFASRRGGEPACVGRAIAILEGARS